MQSEATIAKPGDQLVVEAIGQLLVSFNRDDKHLKHRQKVPLQAQQAGGEELRHQPWQGPHQSLGLSAKRCALELSVRIVNGHRVPRCAASMTNGCPRVIRKKRIVDRIQIRRDGLLRVELHAGHTLSWSTLGNRVRPFRGGDHQSR